jgi:ribose 5-phosphate isomerase
MSIEREKQAAAEAAAGLVEDGMVVGLGTGSTVACLLPALALAILTFVRYVRRRRSVTALRQLLSRNASAIVTRSWLGTGGRG